MHRQLKIVFHACLAMLFASQAQAVSNDEIANIAESYTGKLDAKACPYSMDPVYKCQCKSFVQNVLIEAGTTLGSNGYCACYEDADVQEVELADAKRGDVIQVMSCADKFMQCPVDENGNKLKCAEGKIHTAIFLGHNGDGTIRVIDTNWKTAECNGLQDNEYEDCRLRVKIHDWDTNVWPGKTAYVRVFRFGTVYDSNLVDDSILKCPGKPNHFHYVDGKKWPIANEDVYFAQGWTWNQAKEIPCSELDCIPTGGNVGGIGSLMRTPSNPSVFYVDSFGVLSKKHSHGKGIHEESPHPLRL